MTLADECAARVHDRARQAAARIINREEAMTGNSVNPYRIERAKHPVPAPQTAPGAPQSPNPTTEHPRRPDGRSGARAGGAAVNEQEAIREIAGRLSRDDARGVLEGHPCACLGPPAGVDTALCRCAVYAEAAKVRLEADQ